MEDIKKRAAQFSDLTLDMEQINGLANVMWSAFSNDAVTLNSDMYMVVLYLLSNMTQQFLNKYTELSLALKTSCETSKERDKNEPV